MDLRHAAEGLDCTAASAGTCCGAGGLGGKLSVDSRAAAGCCCCDGDCCECEGGSNGLESGSEPSAAAFLRKKELPALRKELPSLDRLGLAAMIVLTVGDGSTLIMSIDCLQSTASKHAETEEID